MRLNFSGSDEDEIREGVRRIGKVVWEQVALYETITGEHRLPHAATDPAAPGREAEAAAGNEADRADVLPLRRRER
jgi:2-aminoadipate transaminase